MHGRQPLTCQLHPPAAAVSHLDRLQHQIGLIPRDTRADGTGHPDRLGRRHGRQPGCFRLEHIQPSGRIQLHKEGATPVSQFDRGVDRSASHRLRGMRRKRLISDRADLFCDDLPKAHDSIPANIFLLCEFQGILILSGIHLVTKYNFNYLTIFFIHSPKK